MTKPQRLWTISYLAGLAFYSWLSFSLTAPNLVLTGWPPYWQFQTWMWQTLFNNRPLLTGLFAVVAVWLVVSYGGLVMSLVKAKLPGWRRLVIGWLVITAPLLVASNALSYDVFNYIFNAKMVLVYQANPHVQVALDFWQDPWTRFMHNTHTPAPYGYGWTALSLLPFTVSFGKFTLNWLLFRAMGLISLGLTFGAFWLVAHRTGRQLRLVDLAIVFLNPLLLIEVVGNMHNDLWMMAPAVVALGLVAARPRAGDEVVSELPSGNLKVSGLQASGLPASGLQARAGSPAVSSLQAGTLAVSAAALAVSISIKLATVALLPLWLGLVACRLGAIDRLLARLRQPRLKQLAGWSDRHWPLVASLLMMVPLLTPRSQQFLPWYLTWVIVWLPLLSTGSWQRWWRLAVIGLSITSLLRYLPFLLAGEFNEQIIIHQKLITWLPWLLSLVPLYWWQQRTMIDGELT
ncbi:MAG: hypothetical protein COU69_04710 [Candidatus Pacebacteria bacterium CG10_big_fil_rev_8_21_14_0_10_56_10]|nr:MAG: hypothetical protein COU69_04710 [Candidatus Pacebacteria bacterium CG10_big_fil_rev_8_21_14_0_10_56_10]